MDDASQIVPVLRYQDVEQAAGWLCRAFGFRRRRVVRDAAGDVSYILLASGRSTLLVRPVSSSDFDDLMVQPGGAGRASTQVCYLTVSDLDAHYRRAAIAGADIELAPRSDGLGGLFYSCRDLDGHLWSFGTRDYRPGPRLVERLGTFSWRASQCFSVMTAMAVAAGVWAFHPDDMGQVHPVVTAAAPASVRSDDGGSYLPQRSGTALDSVRQKNSRVAAEVAPVCIHERAQRAIWEQFEAELGALQTRLTRELAVRDTAIAEAARSAQEMNALRADLELQKQQRAALQEQLQTVMTALVDARQEALAPRLQQPSSVRTKTIDPPRPQRAVRVRPAETIACYRRVMGGNVDWGGGTEWLPHNAHTLCADTHNARRTIGCFEAGVRAGRPWRDAIAACRAT